MTRTQKRREGRRVVVSTTIPRTVDGFYGEIIDVLRADGFQVHVITSDGPEVPRLRRRADEVHIIPMARQVSLVKDIRALALWIRTLGDLRPGFVLAGTPKAGLLGMVAARLTRTPRRAYFLQGLRLEGVEGLQSVVLGRMEWLTSRCSQVVIAVSPSLASRYEQLGLAAGRSVVVPHNGSSHGVDMDYFVPLPKPIDSRADLGLQPDTPVVTFMGRLTADKGPKALLGALNLVRESGTEVQLLVLGAQDEGDSSFHVNEFRRSQTPVTVLDHIQDVRPCLGATDVLVLPTRREGMPNAVLEAAAMGKPAITTDATGAIDSVIDGVTGIIVPVDDVGALGRAIISLISDESLRTRMGAAALARVTTDFQPADVARAVVDLGLGWSPTYESHDLGDV